MSTATAVQIDSAPFVHSGATARRFYSTWLTAAFFPLGWGVIFYGWRALLVAVAGCASAAAATLVWRKIGRRGALVQVLPSVALAVLLTLTLPARLVDGRGAGVVAALAGVLLAFVNRLLAGRDWPRVQPVVATHLVVAAIFAPLLVTHWTLQRSRAVVGDLHHAGRPEPPAMANDRWTSRPSMRGQDAVWNEPASRELIHYMIGRERTERTALPMQSLIRDRLPPLEDLVVGGHPGPIGVSGAVGVIVGGLFLIHRRVIDYRIPLWIVLSAYAALLALPTPTAVGQHGPTYAWFASFDPRVQWVTGVTFVHYQLMASPLLFMAFFLATWPAVRPMFGLGRAIYSILIGVSAAAAQMYLSAAHGPYFALLLVGFLTPVLDRISRPSS